MCPVINIGEIRLPSYGLIGTCSVIVLILVGTYIIRQDGLPMFDGYVLGAYGLLGAYLGAKIFYLLQNPQILSLNLEKALIKTVRGGGSAYGAILVGLGALFAGGKIHRINARIYLRNTLFLLPLCHGIWKVGCYMSGCCYGIPYNGPGCVVFPQGSHAPAGIGLFPVQLLEAGMLAGCAGICCLTKRCKESRCIEKYVIIYSAFRFVLEFMRNAKTKVMVGNLSDVQYVCVLTGLCLTIILFTKDMRKRKNEDPV